jgi:hypothetical protein
MLMAGYARRAIIAVVGARLDTKLNLHCAILLIGVLLTLGSVSWVWLLLGSVQLAAALLSLAYETRGRNLKLVSQPALPPVPATLAAPSRARSSTAAKDTSVVYASVQTSASRR